MSVQSPACDSDFLDLIRATGPLSVSELAHALEVTPTAIRQRLTRLMSHEIIQREAIRYGRGRPKHRYWLTDKGLRMTGSNFTDLAMALWKEVRSLDNSDLRWEMLRRIAKAMASNYANQIDGQTPLERLKSLAELLAQRRIPVSVEEDGPHPSITTHACPYPRLADADRSICSMERMMFSELVGNEVQLTQCRMEGDDCCRFQTS